MHTNNMRLLTIWSWKTLALGLFHVLWALACGILIYIFWPADEDSMNSRYTIIMVLLSGAAGSFIHSAGSFINFTGEKKLSENWIWWYILRPFVGMGVALVFFIVFKAGLLSGTNSEFNPYGLFALSALAGLSSDRATLKLRELFESLFNPKDDRSGKLRENSLFDNDFEDPDSKG